MSRKPAVAKRKRRWPRAASQRILRRFQSVAAEYDGNVVRAEWEPTFNHGRVFDGPEGGWTVKVEWPITWAFPSGQKHRDVVVGLSVTAALINLRRAGAEHKRLEWNMAS